MDMWQWVRFAEHPRVLFSAQMRVWELREQCAHSTWPLGLLRLAMSRLFLSPRAYHKILRLARAEEIAEANVAEAVGCRGLDRGRG